MAHLKKCFLIIPTLISNANFAVGSGIALLFSISCRNYFKKYTKPRKFSICFSLMFTICARVSVFL